MPPWGDYDSEATAEEWDRGWCSRLTCNVYRALGASQTRRAQTQHRTVAAAVALMLGGLQERVLPPAAVAAVIPVSERGAAETMLRLRDEGWLSIVGTRRDSWMVGLGPRWEAEAAVGGTWSRALRIGALIAATQHGATPARIDALVVHCLEAGGFGRHQVSLERLAATYSMARESLSRATGWLRAKGLVSYAGSRRVLCASGQWSSVKHYEPLKRGASHARENPYRSPSFSSYLTSQTTPQTETSTRQRSARSYDPVRDRGPQCATRGCLNRTRPKPPTKEQATSFDVWCKPCWQLRRWRSSWRRAGGLAAEALAAERKGGFAGIAQAWYLSDTAVRAMQRAAGRELDGLDGEVTAASGLGPGEKAEAVAVLRGARSRVSSVAGAVRSAVEEIAAAEAVRACRRVALGLGAPAAAFERFEEARAGAEPGPPGLCAKARAARSLLAELTRSASGRASGATPPPRPQVEQIEDAEPAHEDGELSEEERSKRLAEAREVLRRAREQRQAPSGGGWPPW